MQKIYILFLTALLATACGNKPVIFPKNKHLSAEKVPINEIFDGYFFSVCNGHLFVQSYRTDSMLFIYKTPGLEFVRSMGAKGRGPDEFNLLKFVNGRTDDLYLSGYSDPFLIKKYAIDSVGNTSLSNTFNCKNATRTIFNQMHIIGDSILLYNDCAYGLGIKKYHLLKKQELDHISFLEDNTNTPTCNSNWGTMTASDSVIVYAYSNKRQIDLYDVHTLKLKKRIIGDYEYVKPSNPMTDIYQYVNVVGTGKYFYVLYNGFSPEESATKSSIIEVYDYAGNPVVEYSFDFSPSTEFCVDEKNGMIYSYRSQNGNQDFLLRYKL